MTAQRVKDSGEFVLVCTIATLVAGLIYVGVLMLNETPIKEPPPMIEGAIRLAEHRREAPAEPLRRKKIEDTKPPEELPKAFASSAKARPAKPVLNFQVPRFAPSLTPGLEGDFSLPSAELGGVGFTLDEVDERPTILRSVPPQYPYGAKRNNIEGRVVVRMLVTTDGRPTQLSINSAEPQGVFEEAAIAAAARWTFRPGKYKGRAVDTWVLLPFDFELRQ